MSGTSPLEERISIYLFGRSRVGAAIPKVVTVPQVGGQTYFCCLSAGKYSGTSLHTPRQMLQVLYRWTNFFPKQQRQGAAAGCGGKVPLPGAHANAPSGGVRRLTFARQRSVSIATFAAHNKRGGRQDTAAGCGGKVPLPGAHANAPPGGVRRLTFARQRSVSIATFAAHNKRGQRRERM